MTIIVDNSCEEKKYNNNYVTKEVIWCTGK